MEDLLRPYSKKMYSHPCNKKKNTSQSHAGRLEDTARWVPTLLIKVKSQWSSGRHERRRLGRDASLRLLEKKVYRSETTVVSDAPVLEVGRGKIRRVREREREREKGKTRKMRVEGERERLRASGVFNRNSRHISPLHELTAFVSLPARRATQGCGPAPVNTRPNFCITYGNVAGSS